MESETIVLSKFKENLGKVIEEYKNNIVEIEKEEDFIRTLGDLINYCKSDVMLLPFYDITILSRVFERIFPLSKTEINKINSAKYLIEASSNIDKNNFLQYNNAIEDVNKINDKINEFYENLMKDNNLINEKDNYNLLIEKYSKIYSIIDEYSFNDLIDDIDLFQEIVYLCSLNDDEINLLLDIAIKNNLEFLNNNGILTTEVDEDILNMKDSNYKVQEAINDLNNLLDASV